MSSTTEITYDADLSTDDTRHYDVVINGVSISTTVTRNPDSVDAWINAIQSPNPRRLVIGLDLGVQILPYDGEKVATLHLSVSRRCLVFQIHLAAELPPSLEQFFTDPKNIFVGLGARESLSGLRMYYGIDKGEHAAYEDLGVLVAGNHKRLDLWGKDVSELSVFLNGVEVEMPIVDSEWHVDVLTEDKVKYASVNTYLSWEFGYSLLKPDPEMSAEEWTQLLSEQPSVDFDVLLFDATITTTRVTKLMTEVERWLEQFMNDGNRPTRYVGFDIEFFYLNNQPHIGTVQFCVGNKCLIIQFHQMNRQYNTPYPYIAKLEDFLLSDNNIFVGVDVERKMHMLVDMLLFVDGGSVRGIDMGRVVADLYQRPDLVAVGLRNREADRPAAGDDWGRWTLTREQVEYAVVHAAGPVGAYIDLVMN